MKTEAIIKKINKSTMKDIMQETLQCVLESIQHIFSIVYAIDSILLNNTLDCLSYRQYTAYSAIFFQWRVAISLPISLTQMLFL